MKIVIAPDSFKGSASSSDIAEWIEDGIHSVIPDCETIKIAIGDGGEGTLRAAIDAGFTSHQSTVTGPVGNPVQARFGIKDSTALVELAEASGLAQLPGKKLEPLRASSFGTGELILHAIDSGARRIILAVGGSACTDAGAGALQALGVRLLDSSGQEIAQGGAALSGCRKIDITGLDSRIAQIEFILACDVDNPLLGPRGAAEVYSPQKGANPEQVKLLEESLNNFVSIAGHQNIDAPGAGAAGGFGYMALTFLGARRQSGIETIFSLTNFHQKIADADFIITGEGRFDSQSMNGKAPFGVLTAGASRNIPVAMVCGSAAINEVDGKHPRFQSIYQLSELEPNVERCISHPQPIVEKIGKMIAQSLIR